MRGKSYYSTSHIHRVVFLAMCYSSGWAILHIEQDELCNGGIIFG